MTLATVTVPARLLAPGDVWDGRVVMSVVTSWDPNKMEITLDDPVAGSTETVSIHRMQLFAVKRDDGVNPPPPGIDIDPDPPEEGEGEGEEGEEE